MKRLGVILLALLAGYFIFLIRQDIIDNLELKREIKSVSAGLSRQEAFAAELGRRLKELQKASYLEQLARTRLGLVGRGETAYKVIKD